jgi:hypothetical protein
MAYQNKMVLLQHLLVGSVCNSSSFKGQSRVAEKQQASPQGLLEISGNVKREPVPLCHSYT